MAPHVLIQPSFGNKQAQHNWAQTLDQEVFFAFGALAEALTEAEMVALQTAHPTGLARFWATTSVHDKKMDELDPGDVVLFTGQKKVLAIGEVGVIFRNSQAGDALWPPDDKNGSYSNIYSLINFQDTDIPYEELNKLTAKPGSYGQDNYMGARLLRDYAAQRVIDGLLITSETRYLEVTDGEAPLWEPGTVVDDEAHNAISSRPSFPIPPFVADRKESALVVAYKTFLIRSGDLRSQLRLMSPVGFSDLYLVPAGGTGQRELIEAKSDSSHGKVREALAQLLDYSAHADAELDLLTALFPQCPSKRDVEWLARYGIGTTYQDGDTFSTIPAPAEHVARMKLAWES